MIRRAFFQQTIFFISFTFFLGCISVRTFSQPHLNFKRITVNWPTIELYYQLVCDTAPDYYHSKSDVKIFENGGEIKNFELFCEAPEFSSMSVALIFDGSGSMALGMAGQMVKSGGHAFVDNMDGSYDQAAVFWFDALVYKLCDMTTAKAVLDSAIDMIPATGSTAIWDGAYAGLLEIVNHGTNSYRAVIVITDGGDNSSTRSPSEVIAYANKNHIKIFMIGLGSGVDAASLESVANQTGGKFYLSASGTDLASIYQNIYGIIKNAFEECAITYQAQCPNGAFRNVEFQIPNYCGGSDTKTKVYRAPLDVSKMTSVYIGLEKQPAHGMNTVDVPLKLVLSLKNEYFSPATFSVFFDSARNPSRRYPDFNDACCRRHVLPYRTGRDDQRKRRSGCP